MMKKYAISILILYIILILIPLPMLNLAGELKLGGDKKGGSNSNSKNSANSNITSGDDSQKPSEGEKKGTFNMLLREQDKVIEISERDFLIGTVSTEMSPTFHSEAFKAQAIAAYNYYSVQRNKQAANPTESLKGADFADSSSGVLIYRTLENLKERWGDNFDTYYKKIGDAVDEVLGKKILHNGEMITAVYHSINSGKTEDAVTVWGADYPYLKPVDSAGDKLSPDYEKMVSFTSDELKTKLANLDGELKLDGGAESWISEDIKRTASSTITEIKIGGKAFTGRQIRETLGLRSASFEVKYSDGKFVFTTHGYGHGVGMSQYGADYMARQGATWEEIIKTYYTGVTIE